ncbi:MAG: c-type cytochrome [Candidatus Hodgkinia cicadicola]
MQLTSLYKIVIKLTLWWHAITALVYIALARAAYAIKPWYICALAAALVIMPLALAANRLFPSLAEGEAKVLTKPSAAAHTSLKRLLLSSSVNRGEKFYNKCAGCHSIERSEPNKAGPNLWNIMFANIAAKQDFNYSPALKARSNSKWGFETLNKFLKSPSSYIKGTYMAFSGLTEPAERMDVLSYLNSKSTKPHNINKLKFRH